MRLEEHVIIVLVFLIYLLYIFSLVFRLVARTVDNEVRLRRLVHEFHIDIFVVRNHGQEGFLLVRRKAVQHVYDILVFAVHFTRLFLYIRIGSLQKAAVMHDVRVVVPRRQRVAPVPVRFKFRQGFCPYIIAAVAPRQTVDFVFHLFPVFGSRAACPEIVEEFVVCTCSVRKHEYLDSRHVYSLGCKEVVADRTCPEVIYIKFELRIRIFLVDIRDGLFHPVTHFFFFICSQIRTQHDVLRKSVRIECLLPLEEEIGRDFAVHGVKSGIQ